MIFNFFVPLISSIGDIRTLLRAYTKKKQPNQRRPKPNNTPVILRGTLQVNLMIKHQNKMYTQDSRPLLPSHLKL